MTEKTYCKEFCKGRFVTEINRLDKALEEYKTKIRAEVIEECIAFVKDNDSGCGNEWAIAQDLEQLKEQRGE